MRILSGPRTTPPPPTLQMPHIPQCAAITLLNRQCSRLSRPHSDYCYQHVVKCAAVAAAIVPESNMEYNKSGRYGRVFADTGDVNLTKVVYKSETCEKIKVTCERIMELHDKLAASPIASYFTVLKGCAPCGNIPDDATRSLPAPGSNVRGFNDQVPSSSSDTVDDYVPLTKNRLTLPGSEDAVDDSIYDMRIGEGSEPDEDEMHSSATRTSSPSPNSSADTVDDYIPLAKNGPTLPGSEGAAGSEEAADGFVFGVTADEGSESDEEEVHSNESRHQSLDRSLSPELNAEGNDPGTCRMVQIQSRVQNNLTVGELFLGIERVTPSTEPYVELARRRWGAGKNWHLEQASSARLSSDQANVFNMQCGIMFEIYSVAMYMNLVLEIAHGDLVLNHLNNILFSGTTVDGKLEGLLTIVDLDDLSKHVLRNTTQANDTWRRFSDTRTNTTNALKYMQVACDEAYVFVTKYLAQDQRTEAEWKSRMNIFLRSGVVSS